MFEKLKLLIISVALSASILGATLGVITIFNPETCPKALSNTHCSHMTLNTYENQYTTEFKKDI